MTAGRENVAIFNPLVLPLPSWHPDGPDGAIDGFVIPFVFPDDRPSGRKPNRGAKITVHPSDRGWRASLRNCQDHAETAEQARAFAAAWIRAAEILENATAPQRVLLGEGQTVDQVVVVEIVDDDEDQDQPPRVHICDGSCPECQEDQGPEACAHCGNVGQHNPQCPTQKGDPVAQSIASKLYGDSE